MSPPQEAMSPLNGENEPRGRIWRGDEGRMKATVVEEGWEPDPDPACFVASILR